MTLSLLKVNDIFVSKTIYKDECAPLLDTFETDRQSDYYISVDKFNNYDREFKNKLRYGTLYIFTNNIEANCTITMAPKAKEINVFYNFRET